MAVNYEATSLPDMVAANPRYWNPQHVTTTNETHSFKTAKIKGDFAWHSHPNTDEVFICVSGGPFRIELSTKASSPAEAEKVGADQTVELKPGDFFKVPRDLQHRPRAEVEAGILLVEKVGTVNTGDRGVNDKMTVLVDESKH